MTIAGLKRQLPLCKVTDDLYIAAFIMFSDVEITKASAAELLKKAPEFDVLLTAEQQELFESVDLNIIPEYYFEAELREAGQAL